MHGAVRKSFRNRLRTCGKQAKLGKVLVNKASVFTESKTFEIQTQLPVPYTFKNYYRPLKIIVKKTVGFECCEIQLTEGSLGLNKRETHGY